jgi:hypothetical protein
MNTDISEFYYHYDSLKARVETGGKQQSLA